MLENEWLTSTDPAKMLAWLTATEGPSGYYVRHNGGRPISDRRLRLFASACHPGDANWKRWAEGGPLPFTTMTGEEGARYCVGIKVGQNDPGRLAADVKAHRAAILIDVAGNPWQPQRISRNGRTIEQVRREKNSVVGCCNRHADNMACDCLALAGTILPAWLTDTVVSLAEAAYECRPGRPEWGWEEYRGGAAGREVRRREVITGHIEDGTLDPHRLMVLADALEEAGCIEQALLRHLRGWEPCWSHDAVKRCDVCDDACWVALRGPCVRGCWAVDLILEKEYTR